MDEPWIIYYEELHERGAGIPDHERNRTDDMAEAAHEAFEATTDRLVNQVDWSEQDALQITKGFGRVVEAWIEQDELEWEDLLGRLEAYQQEWSLSKERV